MYCISPMIMHRAFCSIQGCVRAYGQDGVILTVSKVLTVCNGDSPAFPQTGQSIQQVDVDRGCVMTKDQAGDLLHDRSTLQLPNTGTDGLDTVEALVILKEQNVLFILRADFARSGLKQEISQVAAKQRALCLAREEGMPGGGRDMR